VDVLGGLRWTGRPSFMPPIAHRIPAPMAVLARIDRSAGVWPMSAGTVERAFQLAPTCKTMDELQAKLIREGHTNVAAHLQDSLRRELRKLLKASA